MHMKDFSKNKAKIAYTLLRLSMGWLFFYAGFSKIINPEWTAAGYLQNANTFPELFAAMAQPGIIEIVNILNEWGLLLVGVGLLLGLFTRIAAFGGVILMVLYYLPVLNFPHVAHGYLVDDHIIYMAALFVLIAVNAGHYFGLDRYLKILCKKKS